MKAPLGEQPPPLVLSPAICGSNARFRVAARGRRLWQGFRADLGKEGGKNKGSQEREENNHKVDPDRPQKEPRQTQTPPKIGPGGSQERQKRFEN